MEDNVSPFLDAVLPKTDAERILVIGFLILGLTITMMAIKWVKENFPGVVIQIFAGILLGVSVLGQFFPELFHRIFPAELLTGMKWIEVPTLLFLGLMVGLEMNPRYFSRRGGFPVTSISTVLVPMILSGIAAYLLASHFQELLGSTGSYPGFVMAMGIAGSVTALPVLQQILKHMGITKTRIGQRAYSYAMVNDMSAYLSLTFVLAYIIGAGMTGAWLTLLSAGVFVLVMIFLVRPMIRYALEHRIFVHWKDHQLLFVVSVAMVAGFIADRIGIHFLLGAVLTGAIVPKHCYVAARSMDINFADGFEKMLRRPANLLLPFFFMSTGLRTNLHLEHFSPALAITAVTMIGVTALGKFFGTYIPIRWFGGSRREAAAVGTLMNTMGLMEVVILNIMLSAGLISSVAFAAMMLVTLFKTAATMPITKQIIHQHPHLTQAEDHVVSLEPDTQAV